MELRYVLNLVLNFHCTNSRTTTTPIRHFPFDFQLMTIKLMTGWPKESEDPKQAAHLVHNMNKLYNSSCRVKDSVLTDEYKLHPRLEFRVISTVSQINR